MKFDVVCFGALNVDKLYKVDHISGPDEESEILEFKEAAGGSAANTAVGLSRLGLKTSYIGKIALDKEGTTLLNSFIQEGVETRGIIVSSTGSSGLVIGFVDKKGERALYLKPGVNNSLDFRDIRREYANNAKLLHLSSFAGNIPFNAQKKLVKSNPNISVTLDPGMFYANKGLKSLKPIIERCFVIFPNKHELKILTGRDYERGAEILLSEGVKIVAVKLGNEGCYITNGEEKHLIKKYDVNVIDSTGAGDAFCSGFIYGLLKNKNLRECGVLGNYVASRTITTMGARNGLPREKDLSL
jgi:ribokinase